EVLVMDWGLALVLGAPPANVAMGGTPGYMAPEMAMGPIDAIGFHSDVYLLGAILYEIVTGLRPHTGKTITRCLMAAAKNEIVRALFAYQEAYTLWDGNTKAKGGIVEAALAYAESAERKADYDLGLSLLSPKEPAHAPVIERLAKGRNERESRKRRLQVLTRVG